MTKSELIDKIAMHQRGLTAKEVDLAVGTVLAQIADALAQGERVEVRGFGSFSLHFRKARIGRNPRTGEAVSLESKYVPHFKPGKELRERVNDGLTRDPRRVARGVRGLGRPYNADDLD